MKINKISKIISSIFLVLIINLFFAIFIKTNVSAAENNYNTNDEKIIQEINLNDNFDTSSVIVVLKANKSQYREISKEILDKFYAFNEIVSLEDLTKVPTDMLLDEKTLKFDNTETINHLSNINFKQIIKVNLNTSNKSEVVDIIKKLELLQEILYVGPNYIYMADTVAVDDERFSEQWALSSGNGINVSNAWDFSVGTRDVRVGIIDSGIASHEDLNTNVVVGYDYFNNNTVTSDDIGGHGTSVAGIIGAIGNNKLGISGINHRVSLVPLQTAYDTSGSGSHNIDDVVEAIRAARDLWETDNRISIINYSISNYGYNTVALAAIEQFQGLFVWSAGNNGTNLDDVDGIEEFSINNLIAVGAHDNNNNRSIWSTTRSSSYGNAVDIYAPGGSGTTQTSVNCSTTHSSSSSSYRYFNGTSCAAPHVTGVAALLLSLNKNLTTIQLRTAIIESADTISITVPDTSPGAIAGNTISQNVLKLNAYNAVKYVLENYMNPTTYTLSNYSSTINTNKTITSDASYFDELNGFYKLNVTYAKSYEFISSSTSEIEVALYDEDFTEIPFNDLDSTNNKVHFIESLSSGTYYLKTKYANEESTGTINTQIVSRTTAYIGVGDNDVLLNTHNYNEGIYLTNYYYYINSSGVGFYRFTLTGVKADGTTVTYPYNSIVIKDHMNEDIIDKYSLTGYSNQAISGYNENTFVAYLNASGYFYVHIDIDTDGLKSLTLNIEPVESETIDLFTKSESTNSIMEILDSETTKGDYAKKIILKQAGKFTVNYSYSGSQSSDILFVLGKLNYNSTTQKYTIETLISQLMDAENDSFTYTLGLTDGTYFVAYFNKDDNAAFDVTFNRLVTQYGGNVLIPDPDSVTDGGSQVEVYEKDLPYYEVSYGGTNIVIGFTRVIYLDYHYVTQSSRYDYYWYSSNISIATVSQHGTVFGKSAGTVKIMAVNKDDPSIAFVKQFTIVQDTKTYSEVIYSEFSDTHKLSDGKYRLGLNVQNSPYPMVQYYSWRIVSKSSTITSVSIDQWGNVTIIGTGDVVIEGYDYIYNNNYGVRINLTVTN